MQRLGIGRGVDAEILGQADPHGGVDRQRRRRPAGGRQCGHQRPQDHLVVRVVVEGAPGQAGRAGQVPGRQCRPGADLAGRGHQPIGGRPFDHGPRGVGFLGQERAACQGGGGFAGGPGERRAPAAHPPGRLIHQLGEGIDVEPVGHQRVAGVATGQAGGAEHAPQPADQHPHLLAGPFGAPVRPEALGQTVGTDRSTAGEGQHLQQCPGLATAQQEGFDALHLEASEQTDPHLAHPSIISHPVESCSGSTSSRVAPRPDATVYMPAYVERDAVGAAHGVGRHRLRHCRALHPARSPYCRMWTTEGPMTGIPGLIRPGCSRQGDGRRPRSVSRCCSPTSWTPPPGPRWSGGWSILRRSLPGSSSLWSGRATSWRSEGAPRVADPGRRGEFAFRPRRPGPADLGLSHQ